MKMGRVYRRQDLLGQTTALDRDLKSLVSKGLVKKLSGGLYYRPRKSPYGTPPPPNEALVKAFLKTDDFLLTSYDYFTQLGLGLTQVYNHHLVYNHKRSGYFLLGGKRFKFRVVPAFPTSLTKEYLLVDMLNNLTKLPDNSEFVERNLKTSLREYDQKRLHECLAHYGRPMARKILAQAYA